jgi:hypothetical protein
MATVDKLKNYVTAIADAIRTKEGSTENINPQDFVDRINALSIGGGGEEYGVYLKILEVPAKIDGGVDSTLNVDSPEVVEFFSDAFGWTKEISGANEDSYVYGYIPNYLTVVAYEKKKKDMGLPNVYDTLQKRIPLLAIKTKSQDVEKIVMVDDIARNSNGEIIGNNYSFSVNLDDSEDSIYNMWVVTIQFRKGGIYIASID